MNPSQTRDRRFWRSWEDAGALGTIGSRYLRDALADYSLWVWFLIQNLNLPAEILTMEGLSREEVQCRTTYWQIGLLYRINNTEKVHGLLRYEHLHEIKFLLRTMINREHFRTAEDFPSESHPELQLGEMWMTNADEEEFEGIGLASKRRGVVAYDHQGKTIEGRFPVFVLKSVVDKAVEDARATAH